MKHDCVLEKGKAEPTPSTLSQHRLWLMIGIILAIVAVLSIVFISPAQDALFGKAIGDVCSDDNDCDEGEDCVQSSCTDVLTQIEYVLDDKNSQGTDLSTPRTTGEKIVALASLLRNYLVP